MNICKCRKKFCNIRPCSKIQLLFIEGFKCKNTLAYCCSTNYCCKSLPVCTYFPCKMYLTLQCVAFTDKHTSLLHKSISYHCDKNSSTNKHTSSYTMCVDIVSCGLLDFCLTVTNTLAYYNRISYNCKMCSSLNRKTNISIMSINVVSCDVLNA